MDFINKYIIKNPKIFIVLGMGSVITTLGIIFKQPVYRIVPLYISLVVMLLQSTSNRYCFLVGGLNCILYSIVNFSLKMYGSALQTFLISFPVQVLTFIRWNKNKYKSTTEFKKLTPKMIAILSSLFVVVWIIFRLFITKNSRLPFLDTTNTVEGFFQMYMSLVGYWEYSILVAISAILGITTNILISIEIPSQLTYVAFSTYSLTCSIFCVINTYKIYKEQKINRLKTKGE